MSELSELIENITKKEDGVYIKLKQEKCKKALEELIDELVFYKGNNFENILKNIIEILGYEEVKNIIVNNHFVDRHLFYSIRAMPIKNIKILAELKIIDPKKIVEKINDRIEELETRHIKKLSNIIQIPKELFIKRIYYLVDNIFYFLEELTEIKDLEVCREILNSEKVMNAIYKFLPSKFEDLKSYRWWENSAEFIIHLAELKDLLNEENKKKIENFFASRIKEIKILVRYRYKKEEHREYIKALIKLLPDEARKEFLTYFF